MKFFKRNSVGGELISLLVLGVNSPPRNSSVVREQHRAALVTDGDAVIRDAEAVFRSHGAHAAVDLEVTDQSGNFVNPRANEGTRHLRVKGDHGAGEHQSNAVLGHAVRAVVNFFFHLTFLPLKG